MGILGKIEYRVREILGRPRQPQELPPPPPGQTYAGTVTGETILVTTPATTPTTTPATTPTTTRIPAGTVSQPIEVARDIPKPPGVITPYTPPTVTERISTIPGYVRRTIKTDPLQSARGTAQIIRGDVMAAREERRRREREVIRTGTADIQVEEEILPYQARGTISADFARFEARPFTEEELLGKVTAGEISPQVATQELEKRESSLAQSRLEREFRQTQEPRIKQLEATYQSRLEQESEMISKRGDLTFEQKNELLEQRAEILNKELKEEVALIVNEFEETRGKEVRDETTTKVREFRDKAMTIKQVRTGVTAAGVGFFAAPAIGVAAATLPPAQLGTAALTSKVLGITAVGATAAGIGMGLQQDYDGQGRLTGWGVASRLSQAAPLIGFYAGAKAGAKVFNPKVDRGQLDTAMKTAKTQQVGKPISITKESQITELELTNQGKLQAKTYLQSGYKVEKVKYTIVNEVSSLNKVLKKAFPIREITFLQVTDMQGNLIKQIGMGRIRLGGGRYVYKEDIIKESIGVRDARGMIRIDAATLRKTPVGIKEVRTQEFIKPIVRYYQTPTGEVKRVVTARTAIFPEDAKTPSQIFRSAELQKLVKVRETPIILRGEEPGIKTARGFVEREFTYQTIDTAGYGKRVLPGVDFKKIKTPAQAVEVSSSSITLGGFKKIPGMKTIQVSETVLTPPTTIDQEILKGISTADFITPTTPPLTMLKLQERERQQMRAERMITSAAITPLSVGRLREDQITTAIITDRGKWDTIVRTTPQIINTQQLQKQLDKTTPPIPSITPLSPPSIRLTPIPTIMIPPPLRRLPKGIRKPAKEITKRTRFTPRYAATLASAAVQSTPLKITKEQYKKLAKKKYLGIETRPVVEIVSKKELKKAEKELQKVDFGISL
jgi:hypothetical protein